MEATLALLGWQCVVDQWPVRNAIDWNLCRGEDLVSFDFKDGVTVYRPATNVREARPFSDMPDTVFRQLAPYALEQSNER
ncbi:hypothetical protein [Burkholderia sp. JKS000303]|uniref:hypothetical protein n=1 Tax=Burkholderia sp. JKS000303 TaxID=1938747 RepID=UPI00117FBE73|nr:hypothetical protein [Burkholderia sp. JKS000303]